MVLCQNNESRYTTFAKIVLCFPIILPVKSKQLERICNKKYKNLLDPLQSDYNISVIRYLKYNSDNDSFIITEIFDDECVPINITGIYTLYLALCYIESIGSKTATELLKSYSYNILVTPPQTRYAYISQSKNILGSPDKVISQHINSFYITLIRLSKHAWSEFPDPDNRRTSYITQIATHRKSKTILSDHDLLMYDGLVSKYQYFTNNIYLEVLKLLSGKNGYVRKDFELRSFI